MYNMRRVTVLCRCKNRGVEKRSLITEVDRARSHVSHARVLERAAAISTWIGTEVSVTLLRWDDEGAIIGARA